MDDNFYDYLGTGWSFPPTFSKKTKGVVMVSDEEDIAQSLKIIIFTNIGERYFHPQMGTNLSDYLYIKNVNIVVKNRISQMVEDAIIAYEHRVRVDNVNVDFDDKDNVITISVAYTILAFNTQHNMVFPFYIG